MSQLVRTLEDLERAGVRHLSVPPDAELAALRPAPAPAPAAAPQMPLRGPARHRPLAPSPAAGSAAAVETPRHDAAPPSLPPVGEIATLESLFIRYRDCRQCKLCETRNRLVFGTGNPQPRLMFIGEGPGAEEDQQGLPFVGRAGQLLTGMIAAMGLVREDVYITNVVKCRPPGNRNPEPDEVAACRPILKRQIELLNPTLIVTLGNVPLKALNPAAGGITRERGRVFQFERWAVLPTFHPSYLLRSPDALGECWADFRLALSRVYPEA
jgi:DNA polymerase